MRKEDKEEIKQIVNDAVKNNHSIDFEDLIYVLLGSTLLLTVFTGMVSLILSVAGVI